MLEAEREAALALSEQKAEEAKLIKARQEGFQAALELLGDRTFAGTTASAKPKSRPPIPVALISRQTRSLNRVSGATAGRSAN